MSKKKKKRKRKRKTTGSKYLIEFHNIFETADMSTFIMSL